MDEKLRKLMIRQSELREKVNTLQAVETRSTEQDTELTTARNEYATVERELRAALADTGEPVEDAETRERREIRARTGVHEFVSAAMRGNAPTGAAAEIGASYGCPGLMPLEILRPEPEVRAVTPAPTVTAENQQGIQPDVFLSNVAGDMRIDMPTAETGTPIYTVLTTSLTGAAVSKSKNVPLTAGAYSTVTCTPTRYGGSFDYAVEDAAVLAGHEAALRENLDLVLSNAFDDLMINGQTADAAAGKPALSGMLALVTPPTAEGTTDTFATYSTKAWAAMDGLYADSPAATRWLVGPETARHMGGVYYSTTIPTSAWERVRSLIAGIRSTDRIGVASGVQAGLIVKTSIPGMVAVAPRWQGIEVVRDPYQGARAGEVRITAYGLASSPKLIRADAFKQESFKTT